VSESECVSESEIEMDEKHALNLIYFLSFFTYLYIIISSINTLKS